MRAHKFVSKIHKWVGLIVGIQFLCWTLGGVVMTWIPIEQVRGEHNLSVQEPGPIQAEKLGSLLSSLGNPGIMSVRTRLIAGEAAADVSFADGSTALYSIASGAKLTPLDETLALAVAEADFAGEAGVPTAALLDIAPYDYRGKTPVWQVDMHDEEGTLIYVSPSSGRVVARRNDVWRFYDFFWMLHIMDYDTRDNFNNPLVMVAAGTAFIFALSGLALLIYRFGRRDFGLKPKKSVRP
ncbi:PepSY domain-containing protein [Kordiimonas sp.]|uniref:PepSY domain-containing protein n=1 Tax=Kordiimonas sp. TaxID=1970157 RepID=UPI003A92456A